MKNSNNLLQKMFAQAWTQKFGVSQDTQEMTGRLVFEYLDDSIQNPDIQLELDKKTGHISFKTVGQYALAGWMKLKEAKSYLDSQVKKVNDAIDELSKDITKKGIVDEKGHAFQNVVKCISGVMKGIALLGMGLAAASLIPSMPFIGSIGSIILGTTATAAVWQGGGDIVISAVTLGIETHRHKTGEVPGSLSEYADAYKGMKFVQAAAEGINKTVDAIRDTAKQPDVDFNKALDSVKSMTSEIAEGAKKLTGQLHDAFEVAKRNPNIIHETTAKVQHASEKMLAKTKELCSGAQEKISGLVQDVKKSISQEVSLSRSV